MTGTQTHNDDLHKSQLLKEIESGAEASLQDTRGRYSLQANSVISGQPNNLESASTIRDTTGIGAWLNAGGERIMPISMFLAMDRRIQEGVTNDLPTPGTQTYVEFMNHLAHHYDADIPTRETMNKLYRVRTEFWETTRKEINPEKGKPKSLINENKTLILGELRWWFDHIDKSITMNQLFLGSMKEHFPILRDELGDFRHKISEFLMKSPSDWTSEDISRFLGLKEEFEEIVWRVKNGVNITEYSDRFRLLQGRMEDLFEAVKSMNHPESSLSY